MRGTRSPVAAFTALPSGVRFADLERIERGEADGAPLVRELKQLILTQPWAVLWSPWEDQRPVLAAFAPPEGQSIDHITIGWPAAWFSRSHSTWYRDAFARRGPINRNWQRYTHDFWGWSATGSQQRTYWASEHVDWYVPLPGVAATAVIVLGVWYGLGLARAARKRWRRPDTRDSAGDRRSRLRTVRTLQVAGAAAAALGLLGASWCFRRAATARIVATNFGAPTPLNTGLTVAALHGLTEDPQTGARLARTIAGSAGPATLADDVLGTAAPWPALRSFESTDIGWPYPWIHRGVFTPASASPGEADSHRWRWNIWEVPRADVSLIRHRGGAAPAVIAWTVELSGLCTLVLGCWLGWKASRGALSVAGWLVVRRRICQGRCMMCAYNLAGLVSPGPPVEDRIR